MENIRSAIEEHLAAVNDLLQDIPNAEVRELHGVQARYNPPGRAPVSMPLRLVTWPPTSVAA